MLMTVQTKNKKEKRERREKRVGTGNGNGLWGCRGEGTRVVKVRKVNMKKTVDCIIEIRDCGVLKKSIRDRGEGGGEGVQTL